MFDLAAAIILADVFHDLQTTRPEPCCRPACPCLSEVTFQQRMSSSSVVLGPLRFLRTLICGEGAQHPPGGKSCPNAKTVTRVFTCVMPGCSHALAKSRSRNGAVCGRRRQWLGGRAGRVKRCLASSPLLAFRLSLVCRSAEARRLGAAHVGAVNQLHPAWHQCPAPPPL